MWAQDNRVASDDRVDELVRAFHAVLVQIDSRLKKIEEGMNASVSSSIKVREESLIERLEFVEKKRNDRVRYMDTTPISLIVRRVREELSFLPDDPAERTLKISELKGMLEAADLMFERPVADKLALLRQRGYIDTLHSRVLDKRGKLAEEWKELEGRASEILEHLTNYSRVYSVHLMIPLKERVQKLVDEARKAVEAGNDQRAREAMRALREVIDLVENVVLSNKQVLRKLRIER